METGKPLNMIVIFFVLYFCKWYIWIFFYVTFLQISVAVKKILYAADAKESALAEAQEYISQSVEAAESEEEEDEAWIHIIIFSHLIEWLKDT